MKKFDRRDTIQVGIWTRSSGFVRIPGTQSTHSNSYQHDRTRCSKRKAKSTDGDVRI
jgi:hypothetical protein